MTSKRRRFSSLVGLGAAATWAACATPTNRPYRAVPANEIINEVSRPPRSLASLTAEGRMILSGDGRRQGVNFGLIVSWPNRLRIDIRAPFEGNIATLLIRPDGFAFVDYQNGTFTRGTETSCAIHHVTGLDLNAGDLLTMLAAKTPLTNFDERRLRWDRGTSSERVELLFQGQIVQQLMARSTAGHLDLMESRWLASSRSGIVFRQSQFRTVGDLRLPWTTNIVDEQSGRGVQLRYRAQEVNRKVPPVAFRWPDLHNLTPKTIGCTTPR